MEIKEGMVVCMHYTLKNDAGEILDTTEGQDPILILQGFGNIVGGVETAIEGRSAGDKLELDLEPEEGYGTRDEALRQEVDRSDFEDVDDIQVGMLFQAETNDDDDVPIRIVAIDGDTITVDGNHELADQRLHFSISIESVREAEPEELAHGHVHGSGAHQH